MRFHLLQNPLTLRKWPRRRVLAGAGALLGLGARDALVGPEVIAATTGSGPAQRFSAVDLLRAPKHALVIGNGAYGYAPLRNPVNDARAMGAARCNGFSVTLRLDAGRSEMQDAIGAYAEMLVKAKAVGLFYFAGHGVQLTWRNYLIPLGAEVTEVEQVRERAIDVNSIIEGIRKAANPMNIIILDACRDNPFGASTRAEQRGLSQLDAPPGTLLAYATAPGNVAIDGEGNHGLYTEHLLQEMKVPEAKVEDVFKRVRLAVRRRSNGEQVPWESTSLEEDFWFIPPKEIRRRAEAEIEREYKEELALWQRAQAASVPEPVEEYLRRYPSGRFSELALLKLDQVLARQGEKKVEPVVSLQNPYTHGTHRTDTAYHMGDTYSYRVIDTLTGRARSDFNMYVSNVVGEFVSFNNGAWITDLLGNPLRWGNGVTWTSNQIVPREFVVGKRWNTRFEVTSPKGVITRAELDVRIRDRRSITVPAGSFQVFVAEAYGFNRGTSPNPWPNAYSNLGIAGGQIINEQWQLTTWYAPERARRPIAWEWNRGLRYELTAFSQA